MLLPQLHTVTFMSSSIPHAQTFSTKSKSKSKSHYDQQSVGQSILVSGTHLGPVANFSHSLFDFFFTLSGLLMWGALSDEKSGLYFSVFARHRQRNPSQI
jgi:hypothetical protein